MIKVAGLLLLTGLIAMMEVPRIRRNQWKKELWVFSLLLMLGVGLGMAHFLGFSLPNPAMNIYMIFEPIGTMLHDVLG